MKRKNGSAESLIKSYKSICVNKKIQATEVRSPARQHQSERQLGH
jgi:hypothetical protein